MIMTMTMTSDENLLPGDNLSPSFLNSIPCYYFQPVTSCLFRMRTSLSGTIANNNANAISLCVSFLTVLLLLRLLPAVRNRCYGLVL